MKKFLFFLLISIVSYTSTYAQDPIVIKQDSSVRDLDNGEEQDVRDLPLRQRIRIGGGIGGLQFGNPTVISVSPMVGYQATNDFTVGLAVDYQYYKSTYNPNALSFYGPRAFGQYRLQFLEGILSKAFAQGEIQKYFLASGGQSASYDPQFLAGLGLGFGGFQLTALYNFSYNANTGNQLYGSPVVIRVGGFFF